MNAWTTIAAYDPATSLRASATIAERLGQHIRAENYRNLAQDAENAGSLYGTFAREAAAWAASQEQHHD